MNKKGSVDEWVLINLCGTLQCLIRIIIVIWGDILGVLVLVLLVREEYTEL